MGIVISDCSKATLKESEGTVPSKYRGKIISISSAYIWHTSARLWAWFWAATAKLIFWFPSAYKSSVQFSHSVLSDSLEPHELQHARPPCPSPAPGVHSDSRPLSQWCHPAVSSSIVPFSSCPQSLPASESFPMSQLFAWGGQSTGVSALASFLPEKSQGWSPSEWTSWISLQSKSINSSALCLLHSPTLTSIHDYWKNHSLD